jgi:hypothetical protein
LQTVAIPLAVMMSEVEYVRSVLIYFYFVGWARLLGHPRWARIEGGEVRPWERRWGFWLRTSGNNTYENTGVSAQCKNLTQILYTDIRKGCFFSFKKNPQTECILMYHLHRHRWEKNPY